MRTPAVSLRLARPCCAAPLAASSAYLPLCDGSASNDVLLADSRVRFFLFACAAAEEAAVNRLTAAMGPAGARGGGQTHPCLFAG